MKLAFATALAAVALAAAPAAAAPVFVASNNPSAVVLGQITAGTSYSVTATGISDLYAAFNGGLGLTFTPDGVPTYSFPGVYAGFLPGGSPYDPAGSGPSAACLGAPNVNCGALIGAFVPSIGAVPTSWFQIGSSYSFTAGANGYLIGIVSDVGGYGDNGAEGFTANLVAAVPEPGTWAMMILGFGAVGGMMRRRSVADRKTAIA